VNPINTSSAWIVLVAALAGSGCVTSGDYELIEVQLDATRMALSTRQAACNEAQTAADEHIRELDREIADRQAQLDALTGRHEQERATCDALSAQYAELVAALPDPSAPPKERAPLLLATRDAMAAAIDQATVAAARAAETEAELARVEAALRPLEASGRGVLHRRGGSVVLRMSASTLFNENSVVLSPRGRAIVDELAEALRPLSDRRLEIEGHTSAVPHHSAAFASNWELGFGYAITVLRALQGEGAPQHLMAASLADTMPIPGAPVDANARVEIVVLPDVSVHTRFAPTPPEAATEAPFEPKIPAP
jgi:chemotaxis protein MotB